MGTGVKKRKSLTILTKIAGKNQFNWDKKEMYLQKDKEIRERKSWHKTCSYYSVYKK
ncbi:hypothetical protein [Lacrimispora sp. 210928-DFI.3.58]|uniref:hypothetical protein n=1 Tax=Lacrimispora sp. 210928-DFI.3.58 TaxID=2883214 RepID=UPI001D069251|nr:hypothetical protein [Lacrimispora sp. 210928-DFI.3.58]